MAFEQNFQEPIVHFESDDEDVPIKQKQYSTQAQTTASDNINGCFDCNICLDSAHDPVVTLCGHLYCWPCIYKWLRVQHSSPEPNEQPKCPVCKSKISHSSLVPLYGRGTSPSDSNSRRPHLDLIIPRRPPALSVHPASLPNQPPPQLYHQQYFPQPYGNFASVGSSNFRDAALTSVFSPTVGMFGEMVFARMFGSPETSLFTYPYQNNIYSPLTGSSSPRMRRLEMQVDKSLNRVSIFLFCCFVLCLLLF